MKAHDFIQRPGRKLSSKGLWYGGVLALFKIFKCLGIFIVSNQLTVVHVVQLLFLLKCCATAVLLPLQKPFNSGRKVTKSQWTRIFQHAVLCSSAQILWFYGITFCGPLRAILIFEQSTIVVLAAFSAALFGTGGSSKVRGALLLGLGMISLVLLDRDVGTSGEHAETHKHHSGLNHVFYHVINWFGLADHKGGALLLLLALLLNLLQDHHGRKLAVDLGGLKRLFALSTLISTVTLMPLALLAYMAQPFSDSPNGVSFGFVVSVLLTGFFIFVGDFYADAICISHLNAATVSRYCPTLCFVVGFVLANFAHMSFGLDGRSTSFGPVQHGLSGGVVFTMIFFIAANFVLTAPSSPKAHTGQFIGYSNTGMPLYVYGEDFLQRTSHSLLAFVKGTLKQILSNGDSRKIFYFLCLNLSFTFVEFAFGRWTNSLGLISDAFHMIFDCSALVMGLVAAVMSTWKRTKQYPHGFGRIEVLSGFINGLFLVVIAFFIFLEALERFFDPPEVRTDKLLLVSVAGLCVNLCGMFVFGSHGHSHGGGGGGGGGDSHSHGHSHSQSHSHSHSHLPTHSHSHGGHQHSHQSANMRGIFLHVMADTLGSVNVIISTLLIQNFGWLIADPICSCLSAGLIFASVLPLLKESAKVLLLHAPVDAEVEFKEALDNVLKLDGVLSYSAPKFWQLKSDNNVATLHVQVNQETDQQRLTQQISNIFRCVGVTELVVQIEKDAFYQHVTALRPSYAVEQRISRKPLRDSLLVKAV